MKEYVVDGTFKTTPYPFRQLFVINGIILGKIFSYAYVLMSDQTQNTYTAIFSDLKTLVGFEPRYIVSDFEKAIHNSIIDIFPLSIKKFCIFHFSQSIWKKIQKLGLISQYKNNKEFNKLIRKILCLSLISENNVISLYQKLKIDLLDLSIERINEFFNYL